MFSRDRTRLLERGQLEGFQFLPLSFNKKNNKQTEERGVCEEQEIIKQRKGGLRYSTQNYVRRSVTNNHNARSSSPQNLK